ncbi:hypothetical protein M5K25_004886 [Dendrobium thyrsiflorum]|uniref:Uncharacterized protein n=1 Tax=Dendrobium thyrsiflorum TaxID=117978 RepID=A0ABD0VN66_DENTH
MGSPFLLLAIVALIVGAFLPAAQANAPAPAPASDVTSIDQGVAYILMLVALTEVEENLKCFFYEDILIWKTFGLLVLHLLNVAEILLSFISNFGCLSLDRIMEKLLCAD